MTTLADLQPLFEEGDHPTLVLAVGWLGNDMPFQRGALPREWFERLKSLMTSRFEPMRTPGVHRCDLCQFDGPMGSGNLWVPDGNRLLVCPELIIHTIAAHHYRPPDEFISAVDRCPDPRTPEYRRAFLAAGGGTLLRK